MRVDHQTPLGQLVTTATVIVMRADQLRGESQRPPEIEALAKALEHYQSAEAKDARSMATKPQGGEMSDQQQDCQQQVKQEQEGADRGAATREMPRYKCHKIVWALKIASIEFDIDLAKAEDRETDGTATITPAEDGYAPFKVDAAYLRKHRPEAGGYFVAYEDGYLSFSPAAAFESGYSRI